MFFIFSRKLNSFMHRGEKASLDGVNFTLTNTKNELKRKDDLCLVKKIFNTCYSLTAGVLMLAFKTEILLSFPLALMVAFYF